MVTTAMPRGGLTPLMYAARQGAIDAARALADAGANLNLTDPDGMSALVIAIINAHYDVAPALLDKGADPNVADTTGMAALYAAVDMHTARSADQSSADRASAAAWTASRSSGGCSRTGRPERAAQGAAAGSGSTTAAIRTSARARRR